MSAEKYGADVTRFVNFVGCDLNPRSTRLQGTTWIVPNWWKWWSKAKASVMLSCSITTLLVQSVKLQFLSSNCSNVCHAQGHDGRILRRAV